MVIAISILVSTVVFGIWPVHNALWRFVAHLLMLPIIVGSAMSSTAGRGGTTGRSQSCSPPRIVAPKFHHL